MCGIFGSFSFKNYEKFYNENKKRGTFAYGSLYVCREKSIFMKKASGVSDLTEDRAFAKDGYELYLGHTQAPTSIQREFSPRTSHPFEDMYHIVAHNGVLENAREIMNENLIGHINAVDSSVIPALIGTLFELTELPPLDDLQHKTDELLVIEKACNILKGTFACWIYSKLTDCTYLVRSGSTLFGNLLTGDFSSTVIPGMCESTLKEGIVYCVTAEGLAECGEFNSNSPFFL